ncbi:hypothetical protein QRD89_15960 [Halobacillus sp. ACCC02827]|uniref:hypothetical protein n=1 Tax=Bacillaceae TaxID=186817 RepID=UPI0002A4D046|nr:MULTISPECIES: hypothetical protein [Bacillaceae]ELK45862.1 hypothetical protein D479_13283 [Halobacillus sp. BAB-2008]QHT47954.1 hypothetical protein M662_16175 [Bacillus sp. SB49]WJE15198.1 hypothetical protein QRD89_15960 [Halobacillus sp. ACCC02827]
MKDHSHKKTVSSSYLPNFNPVFNQKNSVHHKRFVQFNFDNQAFSGLPILFEEDRAISKVSLHAGTTGNPVSLNGLIPVTNTSEEACGIVVSLYKNYFDPASIVYSNAVEIAGGREGFAQPVPLLYVDTLQPRERNVTYYLTIRKLDQDPSLAIFGSTTLTATEYGKY